MRANSSSVAGWLVPARGTCSRKLSSPSASIRQTRMPSCASASDRQSPTGPAPITITRSDVVSMRQTRPLDLDIASIRSGLRHHVLGGADPALVGEVEDDTERIFILGLIERIRRGRAACEIGAASIRHLLLRGVEIVHPHAEMIE